jgi:hypothetical protein
MPYDSISALPAYVKKRPESVQHRWLAIWNNVYAKYHDEARAFAAANSILKGKK